MRDKVQHIYSEQRRITSETSKKKGVYLAAREGNYFVAAHETQVFILHLNVAYEPKNDFFDMFLKQAIEGASFNSAWRAFQHFGAT